MPLLPALSEELDGPARRLHTQALADGQAPIAEKLTYLFGTAGCAYCKTNFRLGTAFTDR